MGPARPYIPDWSPSSPSQVTQIRDSLAALQQERLFRGKADDVIEAGTAGMQYDTTPPWMGQPGTAQAEGPDFKGYEGSSLLPDFVHVNHNLPTWSEPNEQQTVTGQPSGSSSSGLVRDSGNARVPTARCRSG